MDLLLLLVLFPRSLAVVDVVCMLNGHSSAALVAIIQVYG